MRDAVILFVHLIVTFTRLARPGGICSVVAESLLVKHQVGRGPPLLPESFLYGVRRT